MQIQIVSKHVDVSQALINRIEARTADAVEKYFSRPGEAFVTVAKEGHGFRVECSVHLPSGVLLNAQGDDDDAYGAAEVAMEKLEKRLRRYKRKLRDRHSDHKAEAFAILQAPASDDGDDDDTADTSDAPQPVVVAESFAEIPTLTVADAVETIAMTDAPVLIFNNAGHGRVNVVFRRPDGHIGWVDPGRAKAKAG